MSSSKPVVSTVCAIVPTYNRRELFDRAVQSVLTQTRKPDYFLILDNHSTDGTQEYLQLLQAQGVQLPQLKVFREEKNLGASRGMRFLFEHALKLEVDWIWVMDDDAIASPSALEELLNSPPASQENTFILASTIVDGQGKWSPPNRPALFNRDTFEFVGLGEKSIDAGQPMAINTNGYCGLLIRREAFVEFGFPRDDFYLWYDDVEYVLRVSQKKGVFLIPRSRIQHFAQALVPHETRWPFSGPLPKVPRRLLWRYYYGNRNLLWMAKQWLSPGQFAIYFAKQMARNFIAPLLLRQGDLPERWALVVRAGLDALFNRLGERVKPNP